MKTTYSKILPSRSVEEEDVTLLLIGSFPKVSDQRAPCTLDRRQQWPTSRSFGHSDSEVRDSRGFLRAYCSYGRAVARSLHRGFNATPMTTQSISIN